MSVNDQAATSYVAINVGGGGSGKWLADADYETGQTSSVTSTIDSSHVQNPAPQSVYQSHRYARTLTYAIPNLTANGSYTVRLHFSETFFHAPKQRLFGISINGAQVLSDFDIFATAGGSDIAIVKTYTTTADTHGVVTIALAATINNAFLAGIELIGGSTATDPSPPPIPPANGTTYPIYSSHFTGNTPFHHTVAELLTAGAVVQSPIIASHYWAEGLLTLNPAQQSGGVGPLYTVTNGDTAYKFSCPTWGACDANGLMAHFPSGAYAQTGTDHHLNSFDPIYLHGEIDGWGGDGDQNHACNLKAGNPGAATCSWGGFYSFNGSGLASGGDSANAGGYAFGLMDVTAQELLQGHIDHALGITESCLDDGGVYPSTIGRTSDAHCPASLEPNAKYGQMIHVKSSVDIASLGFSQYCRVIVQAMQTYGAYTADNNGSWGISLNVEYMNDYAGANPWYSTIFPSMAAGGDGSGSNSNFGFNSCLQRLTAKDIEVIQISPHLPPA